MKKITLLFSFALIIGSTSLFGQARQQLNFGLIGITYDIPVATDIAVSPFAGTNWDLNWLTVGVKGNYYFDNLVNLLDAFDFYAGANAGYAFSISDKNNSDDFDIGLQVGGRWFWSEKWGLYLELGGGKLGGTGGLGITMRM